MSRVLIYGAGHLGKQLHHHVLHYSDSTIVGYVDDTKSRGEPVIDDITCAGGLEYVLGNTDFQPDTTQIVFAIGYANMGARLEALTRVKNAGYTLQNIVHPASMIEPGVVLGSGVAVLSGAILDQGVSLGDGCFVDIGVRVGEDSMVGDNNYLSSGAAIGGGVKIDHSNFVGMDCTITNGIEIGSNNFINAKSLVTRNMGSHVQLVEIHKSRELPYQS